MKSRRGSALIEVLLAIAVFGIAVTGLSGALIGGPLSTMAGGSRVRAALLAEEGVEVLRNLRDASFGNLTDGIHGLAASSVWSLAGSSDTTAGVVRSAAITALDTRRKDIVLTASWQQEAARSGTLTVASRLTNWRRPFGNWGAATQQSTLNLAGDEDVNDVALYRSGSSTYALLVRQSGPNQEFVVVDVTDPAAPTLVGGLEIGSSVKDVAVVGSTAVLAVVRDTQEVMVVDLTNPALPSQLSTLDLPGSANPLSLTSVGTTVYVGRVASAQQEIYILSLLNPSSPSIVGSLELGSNADAENIVLGQNNQYLYVASPLNATEFFVVDVRIPTSPSIVGTLDAVDGSDGTAVAAFSTYAVLGRADGTVLSIDVSSPTSPVAQGSVDIGAAIQDFSMAVGNLNVIATTNTGSTPTLVVSVAAPASPALLGSVTQSGDTRGVVWDFDLNRAVVVGTANTAELSIVQGGLP
ncbi:MAG: hypothetical protein Q8R11_01615 [bacterium]|nr:hypothetical protein [bacterium]